jgi:hypothetical protein
MLVESFIKPDDSSILCAVRMIIMCYIQKHLSVISALFICFSYFHMCVCVCVCVCVYVCLYVISHRSNCTQDTKGRNVEWNQCDSTRFNIYNYCFIHV